jgi:hypothetical protein
MHGSRDESPGSEAMTRFLDDVGAATEAYAAYVNARRVSTD